MNQDNNANWKSLMGLINQIKQCDAHNLTAASIAMSFICIDTMASLARDIDKKKATRSDFKKWVDTYLKAHQDQPYQYRGKDVYAARCALLHTYGSEADLHDEDLDTIKFGFNDGDMHIYQPTIEPRLTIIGAKSFTNDVILAVQSFLLDCKNDSSLKTRVELRLQKVLDETPFIVQ
jgi:hypothetical protein